MTQDELIQFGEVNANISDYLPDYEYQKQPNRQWWCNVLNTLLRYKFSVFVQQKLKDRVKHFVRKKDLNVKALPEFVNIFMKSKNISVQKGRSHYFLKMWGKRKLGEMEDDDKEKLMKANNTISNLNKEVQQMETQIERFKEIDNKYIMSNAKLDKLYRNEIIDSDGELK